MKIQGKTLRASPRKKQRVQIEDDATLTEQSTIHKANRFVLDSPEKTQILQAPAIFDSTPQKDDDQIADKVDGSPEHRDRHEQALSERSVEIETRLAKCASYIDELYHKYDGCLEHIVDIRESKRFYEGKAKEMGHQLRLKLAKLEEAILGPKKAEAPSDNGFLEQQMKEDLEKM